MATNATPQPTAADANSLTPEQIAEQLSAQAAPATTQQAQDQLERDFSVVLETGQTYKAKTKDELIQQLVKAQENASKRIKELSTSPVPPPSAVPVQSVVPEFSNEQYWQLAAQDPRAAQDYVLQFTPEAIKLRQTVSRLEAMEQDIKNRTEVATFQNAVNDFDFENQEVIQKFDENFQKLGLPLTAQNLIMAHNHFVKTGVYQPKAQPQVQPVTNSGIQPLPTLQSHPANGQPTQQIDPNTMTQADLLAYIKSLNGQ
jgi:hypothetical protein